MNELVQNIETQMQTYVAMGEPKDWEATQHLELPDLQLVVSERVENGIYQVQSHRDTSVAPLVPPPTERRPTLRPATRLRSASARPQEASNDPKGSENR